MTAQDIAPAAANRLALVLGATGGIGYEVTRALIAHGWNVRAMARDPQAAAGKVGALGPIDSVAGDAMQAEDVIAAARGAALIVHGVNPPGYRNWRGLAVPMLANTIAAAKASGARIVFPGNVYNFGPDAGAVVGERSPQHPVTRKGKIRVEMERMLADAAGEGVRSLVVRAGDFFGPHAVGSWFSAAMITPGKPVSSVTYPGAHDVGHAWAYLPDLAETMVRLAEAEDRLAPFEAVHFAGHYCDRGIDMARAVGRAAGDPAIRIKSLPWIVFYLAAPFVTFMREALEMRYLWRQPLRLDNARLVALIGAEPHTPLDLAVRRCLIAHGSLPADAKTCEMQEMAI